MKRRAYICFDSDVTDVTKPRVAGAERRFRVILRKHSTELAITIRSSLGCRTPRVFLPKVSRISVPAQPPRRDCHMPTRLAAAFEFVFDFWNKIEVKYKP